MSSHIVILVTTKDGTEAEKILRQLLGARLVACGNIVSGVKSLFWWEGKIDEAAEALLVLKSRSDLFGKITQCVRAHHSYSVPEILALPVADGHGDYLKWIDESAQGASPLNE